MCNDYRPHVPIAKIVDRFAQAGVTLHFSHGIPNVEPRDDIKITDRAPIVRDDGAAPSLEIMRWSWPGPRSAPGIISPPLRLGM